MKLDVVSVVSPDRLRQFCERWKVAELALFGSAARGDMTPDSDVDIAVTFLPDAEWSLFDFASMQLELQDLIGRPVDLVEKASIRNPFRRKTILRDLTVLYAA